MGPTAKQIDAALSRLGLYRVTAAQEIANEGKPDAISGSLVLCLGMRETWLQNINNPAQTDHGCFQISELYHRDFLLTQPGCPVKKWRTSPGHRAIEDYFCPRYTPACVYATDMLHDARAYAIKKGVPAKDAVQVAVAGYNCGTTTAIHAYEQGDVDKYTTGGDYSEWVLAGKRGVNAWLADHPNWRA